MLRCSSSSMPCSHLDESARHTQQQRDRRLIFFRNIDQTSRRRRCSHPRELALATLRPRKRHRVTGDPLGTTAEETVCVGLVSLARIAAHAAGVVRSTAVTIPGPCAPRVPARSCVLPRRFGSLTRSHWNHGFRDRKHYLLALLPPLATFATDQHLRDLEQITTQGRATRHDNSTRPSSGSITIVSRMGHQIPR